jgi:hypothetical protein
VRTSRVGYLGGEERRQPSQSCSGRPTGGKETGALDLNALKSSYIKNEGLNLPVRDLMTRTKHPEALAQTARAHPGRSPRL